MKCKELLDKYNELVPFPYAPEKIAAAGYNVTQFLSDLAYEIHLCDDYGEQPLAQRIYEAASNLRRID